MEVSDIEHERELSALKSVIVTHRAKLSALSDYIFGIYHCNSVNWETVLMSFYLNSALLSKYILAIF